MVQLGNLYFIKQSFFDLVQDKTLPINKPDDENGKHGRPAFCAIKIDQRATSVWNKHIAIVIFYK